MSALLKADLYRILKSKLTMVALIIAVAFPIVMALLYFAINLTLGIDEEVGPSLISANTMIASTYSLSNNIGIVLPIFAGLLVVLDIGSGTIRNKVIAGRSRVAIYLSHLFSSMIFLVTLITIYAAVTFGASLLILKFNTFDNAAVVILRFVITGTACFMYAATVSTFFAMSTKNTALTIIFTMILLLVLSMAMSIFSFVDYEKYRAFVYFIPTFSSVNNGFPSGTIIDILKPTEMSDQIFYEGLASYAFFGTLNTVLGCIIFSKKDMK